MCEKITFFPETKIRIPLFGKTNLSDITNVLWIQEVKGFNIEE
jgi:hypothetical protein